MRSSAARWSLPILFVALMSGCTSAPAPPPAVDLAAIGAAIDPLSPAFAAAIAARDTEAVANMYAEDAHLLAPNMPRADGRAAIRQAYVGFMSMPGMELVPTTNTKIISEAGDMVVELGSYVFKFQDPSGKSQTDIGKYVTIYRKVNGEWKIIVDTFNSDMSMPGM